MAPPSPYRSPLGHLVVGYLAARAADKNARRVVRQGVPPDEAAQHTARGLMVMMGVGAVAMWGFVPSLGLVMLPWSHHLFAALGALLGVLLTVYICVCGLTYLQVAPHRRTKRQARRASLGRLCVLMLVYLPVMWGAMFLGAWIDMRLGLVPPT